MRNPLITLSIVFLVFLPPAARAQTADPRSAQPRIISIDCKNVEGPTDFAFNECVGAGRANEGLRADWQQQLTLARQQCGFRYIRMHGWLDDDMGVYFENRQGEPYYNWQYLDELTDFLVSIHMRPIVELSFMPNALASGRQTIFWYRGNVTPPKDYGKWHDLVQALVRHWTERYGHAEVAQWYFEVWNEPNLSGFWTGTQQDYFKLYTASATAVKSVSPDYKVGGPATAGSAWIADFIAYCASTQSPVDFISTHTYGVDSGFLDAYGNRGTVLSPNPDSISGDIIRTRQAIDHSSLPALPLFYTEWSSSYTPADPIHDSYIEAPFILEKIKQTGNSADAMSYWTFTDIFEEAGPRSTPFHGGFGLMNYQGIEKPAFFAYQFLNRLGPTELADPDKRSIATVNATGDVAVLFWDYTYKQPDNVNDQDFYNKDIPAGSLQNAELRIAHLTPGRYRLTVYRIGYRINDAYDTYLDLGSPSQLTRAQVAIIKARNSGAPTSSTNVLVSDDGRLSIAYPMRENDVYLVLLTKSGHS